MTDTTVEFLYFTFLDGDGTLGISVKEYDGEPVSPCFLFDEKYHKTALLRRPDQMIVLENVDDDFYKLLQHATKVRFVETPEDSSKIVRSYEANIDKKHFTTNCRNTL